MARYLIVGVDPGTTSAIAILDLSGKLISFSSSKQMGTSSAIRYVLEHGRPSLFATDVDHIPEFIQSIATKFGVQAYHPDTSLSISQKIELTKGFDVQNAHERDALAAALNAHTSYKNIFQKIDSLKLPEKVKHLVMGGKSISAAQKMIEENPQKIINTPQPTTTVPPTLSEEQKMINSLRKQVKALKETLDEKEKRIKSIEAELKHEKRKMIEPKPNKTPSNPELISLKKETSRLKKKESLLNRLWGDKIILVGVYPRICGGNTILEQMPEDISQIKVAFTSKRKVKEHLQNNGIAVYDSKMLSLDSGIYFIGKDEIEKLSNKTPSIEKILREYRQNR